MGGATVEKPGMNLATSSDGIPQRSKTDSVWRTQESGESEIRQSVFRIRLPWARPSAYQTQSAISDAADRDEKHLPRREVALDRERARDDQDRDRRDRRAELLEQHDAEDERQAVGHDVLRQLRHGPPIIRRSTARIRSPVGEALRYAP